MTSPKPVRSTRLRNCLGMIWSVSTSLRSSTEIGPAIFEIGSIGLPLTGIQPAVVMASTGIRPPGPGGFAALPLADVDEVALDRRRGGHLRRDEVSAAAAPLAALEVAVRGRGAALARPQDVRIHPQAHRAAGAAPLEAGGLEDVAQPLLLSLTLDLHRPRDDHRPYVGGDPPAAHDLGGRAQVADARVRARPEEDPVDANLAHRRARLKVHVLQRPLGALAVGLGHLLGHRHDLAWRRAPGDLGGN